MRGTIAKFIRSEVREGKRMHPEWDYRRTYKQVKRMFKETPRTLRHKFSIFLPL